MSTFIRLLFFGLKLNSCGDANFLKRRKYKLRFRRNFPTAKCNSLIAADTEMESGWHNAASFHHDQLEVEICLFWPKSHVVSNGGWCSCYHKKVHSDNSRCLCSSSSTECHSHAVSVASITTQTQIVWKIWFYFISSCRPVTPQRSYLHLS